MKAQIFYLACDVEPVSAPAAMLLRAVADAIEIDTEAEPPESSGVPLFLEAARVHQLAARPPATPVNGVRHLGIVRSESAKR